MSNALARTVGRSFAVMLAVAGCSAPLPEAAAGGDALRFFPPPPPPYKGSLTDVAASRYDTCVIDRVQGAYFSPVEQVFCVGSVGIDNNFQSVGAGVTNIPLSEGYSVGRLRSNHNFELCAVEGADAIVECWGDFARGSHDFVHTYAMPGVTGVYDVAPAFDDYAEYFIDYSFDVGVENESGAIRSAGYPQATQIDDYIGGLCAVVGGGQVQCGDGIVANLSHVASLGCGKTHCCAAMSNGSVGCWGVGISGDLGNGSINDETLTAAHVVPGIDSAVQVVAGDDFSCARLRDGSVRCWGSNQFGQLGGGLPQGAGVWYPPVRVANLANAHSLAAGPTHACAIRNDATLWCWGGNDAKQLGLNNGAGATSSVPVLTWSGTP